MPGVPRLMGALAIGGVLGHYECMVEIRVSNEGTEMRCGQERGETHLIQDEMMILLDEQGRLLNT
jgi:hypothetical protein